MLPLLGFVKDMSKKHDSHELEGEEHHHHEKSHDHHEKSHEHHSHENGHGHHEKSHEHHSHENGHGHHEKSHKHHSHGDGHGDHEKSHEHHAHGQTHGRHEKSHEHHGYANTHGEKSHDHYPDGTAHAHHVTKSYSHKVPDYDSLGIEAFEKLWELVQTDSGWKLEAGVDPQKGCVYTNHHLKQYGRKIFRLQGIVDIEPDVLFDDMVYGMSTSPEWNPSLKECNKIQEVNDHSDIYYNVTPEVAGGLVASRDFVSVRHWGERKGIYLSAGQSVKHVERPHRKKYVRGENGPGGLVFLPIDGDPCKCLFTWYVNTDLKGWIPPAVIDQALSGGLLDHLLQLKKHIETLKSEKSSTRR